MLFDVPADSDPYLVKRVHLGGLVQHINTIRRSRRLVMVACGASHYSGAVFPSGVAQCCCPVVLPRPLVIGSSTCVLNLPSVCMCEHCSPLHAL